MKYYIIIILMAAKISYFLFTDKRRKNEIITAIIMTPTIKKTVKIL